MDTTSMPADSLNEASLQELSQKIDAIYTDYLNKITTIEDEEKQIIQKYIRELEHNKIQEIMDRIAKMGEKS